ncbi:MAG: divalent-cation tolerance protein CutA, partial [Pseudomonadota bacterium]
MRRLCSGGEEDRYAMSDVVLVYMTAPDEATAMGLARALVERRLAACANVIPGMRSVYRWKGEIEEDGELIVIAKTR